MNENILDFLTVIEKISDGISVSDSQGHFEIFNRRMNDITGYTIEEANNQQDFSLLLHPDPVEHNEALVRMSEIVAQKGCKEVETAIRTKNKLIKTVLISTSLIQYKNQDMFLSVWRDVTDRHRLERERELAYKEVEKANKKLEFLALKDSHTGLFNYRYLKDALEIEYARAQRDGKPISVIMIDIDYFKSINDVYGHIFGDLILKQFAMRLNKIVRVYDIVVRYGGEEFIIVSPDTGKTNALILAERILTGINQFEFGNRKHQIKIKLSLSVVSYPEDNICNGMALVELADQILNKAKENGGNRVFSTLDVENESETRVRDFTVESLKDKLLKLSKRANQSVIEAIFAFSKSIELNDGYSSLQLNRSIHSAVEIAKGFSLPNNEIEVIKQATMLHDLGKIGIRDTILHKELKLSAEEFEEIKKHPRIGVDILSPFQSMNQIIPLILHHHEKWDGSGYPHGLKKTEIPLGARIIGLVDVYQALISARPYREACSFEKAVEIITENSGTQFDPDVVSKFTKIVKKENLKGYPWKSETEANLEYELPEEYIKFKTV